MSVDYQIRRVTDTEASLSNFNNPLQDIDDAIQSLSERISGIANKSAIILYDQPVETTAFKGAFVYYNSSTGKFTPALAVISGTQGTHGEYTEAQSARVVGVIITVPTNNTARILVGGMYTDSSVTNAAIIGTPTAGTYYLSSSNAGKVTQNMSELVYAQPVMEYIGSGTFTVNIFYQNRVVHRHASLILTGSWTATTVQSQAVYRYNLQSDASYLSLGQLADTTTAVFYNGILQTKPSASKTFWFTQETVTISGVSTIVYALYTSNSTAPTSGSVVICNHFPYANGEPIVRSITSQTTMLSVDSTNGDVVLNLADYQDAGTQQASRAIASIDDAQLIFTPVISKITAGSGITLTGDGNGGVNIASSYLLNTPIECTTLDMNGAIQQSDTHYIKTVFKAGSASKSFRMYMPITGIDTTLSLTVYPWIQALAGSGTLSVSLYFVSLGSTSTAATLPEASQFVTTTIPVANIMSGTAQYIESAAGIAITGPGMICAEISASGNASDISILRMGFKPVVASSGSTVSEVNVTNITCSEFLAKETLAKDSVVYISGSQLALCSASASATRDLAVGITKQAYATGQQATYVSYGTVVVDQTLTPGSPVYVGLNGALVQTVPATAVYSQKIGVALTAHMLQLQIGPAVVL